MQFCITNLRITSPATPPNCVIPPHPSALSPFQTSMSLSCAQDRPLLILIDFFRYETLEEVQDALRAAGLESSNLVIAVDYTKVPTALAYLACDDHERFLPDRATNGRESIHSVATVCTPSSLMQKINIKVSLKSWERHCKPLMMTSKPQSPAVTARLTSRPLPPTYSLGHSLIPVFGFGDASTSTWMSIREGSWRRQHQ